MKKRKEKAHKKEESSSTSIESSTITVHSTDTHGRKPKEADNNATPAMNSTTPRENHAKRKDKRKRKEKKKDRRARVRKEANRNNRHSKEQEFKVGAVETKSQLMAAWQQQRKGLPPISEVGDVGQPTSKGTKKKRKKLTDVPPIVDKDTGKLKHRSASYPIPGICFLSLLFNNLLAYIAVSSALLQDIPSPAVEFPLSAFYSPLPSYEADSEYSPALFAPGSEPPTSWQRGRCVSAEHIGTPHPPPHNKQCKAKLF